MLRAHVRLLVSALIAIVIFGCGGSQLPKTPPPSAPAPSISNLSATSATAGSNSMTVTVNGSGFGTGTTIYWNGQPLTTTVVSSTQVQVTIPASDLATPATAQITVGNSNGTSSAVQFTVALGTPTLTALQPNSVTAGASDTTVTLTGTNFFSGSVAKWNGTSLATTFQSTTSLTATVPAPKLAGSGTAKVVVVNTPPSGGAGGGSSSPLSFAINAPVPSIQSLSPSTLTAGSAPVAITVTGSNFIANSAVLVNGQAYSTNFVDSTHLTFTPSTADVANSGTLTVVVQNPAPAGGTSGPSTLTVQAAKQLQPPVANAGSPQTVGFDATAQLDGSGSTDPNGLALTYSWSFVSKPAGSAAVLSDSAAVKPTFVADAVGTFDLQLIVSDGTLSSAPSQVIITTLNSPPVANAGPDQSATVGSTVTLDGSKSNDADGDKLTFHWTLTPPAGSSAAVSDATAVKPTFVLDKAGTYTAQLIVNDGVSDSAPSTVTVSTVNSPPVANAGANQTAGVGATVTLDGSGSSDVDGDPLTYKWSFNSVPSGSTTALSDPTAIKPTFIIDKPGTYIAQLIVNDGKVDSTPATVTITTSNSPPVANAGANQTVFVGVTVTLDGSASSDVDGNPLTYSWSLTSVPAGSTATLTNPTSVKPTFVVDKPGTYIAQLIVNDGFVNSSPATVTITTQNSPPVANAGANQTVLVHATVQLDGSKSSDVDGDPLTYSWSLTTVPAGSTATLSSTTAVAPTFVADQVGTYAAQLIVNDGTVNSTPSTVTITTQNSAPVANAGANQSATVGSTVQLDGTASYDADTDPLTYSWSFTSKPAGSTATLSSTTAAKPTFTLDKAGDYVVQLIVNDGYVDSSPASVTVSTVNSPPVANAGSNQSVLVGATVQLDGSGSSDVDADPLTYKWSLLSVPTGSSAVLANATTVSPTFVADKAGTYVAQLIVNDGTVNSSPASVTITTINHAPVANAGTGQTVVQGATVTLDGSASSDPDGDTITYHWSLTSVPTGSTATLSSTTAMKPTFVADLAGTYTAQLIVNDGQLNSAPSTVNITATPSNTISLAPSPVNMVTNDSATVTITLGVPAGNTGVTVNLTSDNPSAASFPATVTIPATATTATFQVTTATTTGTANLTAKATGYLDGAVQVNVSMRTMTVTPDGPDLGTSRSFNGTITLAQPAPAGGASFTVTSNSTVVTVSSPVTIAAGATSGTFTITAGTSTGTATLTVKSSGYTDATASVTVTGNLVSLGSGSVTTGPGKAVSIPLSLSQPAPTGGVTVNLSSADTSIATVTSSVFIPQGSQVPAANPQVTGVNIGTTSITASAVGFAPDTVNAIVTVSASLSPSTVSMPATRSATATLTISSPAPAGGITFTLKVDNTSIATVPASVSIAQGGLSATFQINGVAAGTTTLRADSTGITEATASVSVGAAPTMSMSNLTVGKDLVDNTGISFSAATASAETLTITSSDPTKVLLATSATAAGSAQITIALAQGRTGACCVYAQALDSTGTVTLTASAPGYADTTSTVTLDPSGFFMSQSSFSTTPYSSDSQFNVMTAALDPVTHSRVRTSQVVRPGVSPSVTLSSSDTTVATITTNPVAFTAGVGYLTTAVHPAGATGTSTVTMAQPSGYVAPSDYQQFVVTVNLPTISLSNLSIGKDLEDSTGINFSAAPPSDTTVTVSVDDPTKAVLSTSQSVAGAAQVTFTLAAGRTGFCCVYVQALQGSGTATLTVTANGYANGTGTVTLLPSGFFMPLSNFSTTTFSSDTQFNVMTAALDPSTHARIRTSQVLRPGVSASVTLTDSNTTVGTVTTNPVLFSAGQGYVTTAFHPTGAGSTTIAVTQPSGDVAATDYQQFTVTVSAPAITASNLVIGKDLEDSTSISFGAAPPADTTVTVTVDDATKAVLSTSSGTPGTGQVTLTLTQGRTGVCCVYVQALQASGTATLTITAPGYTTGTATVTLDPSGFFLTAGNFSTTTFSSDTQFNVMTATLDSVTSNRIRSGQILRPGVSASVPVNSGNTSVGTITTNPVAFSAGQSYVTTAFHPLGAGSTVVSVTQPTGYVAATDDQQFTVTVTAPAITLGSLTIGKDLEDSTSINFGAAPPSSVTVTVKVSDPNSAVLSTSSTVAGSSQVTFTLDPGRTGVGPVYVQALAGSGSVQLTVSAPGYSDGSATVTLTPSGFFMPVSNFTASVGSADSQFTIQTAAVDANTQARLRTAQLVRPGATFSVSLTDTDTSVGTITVNPLTFSAGIGYVYSAFHPVAAGTATVGVTQPAGSVAPVDYQQFTVTVQ